MGTGSWVLLAVLVGCHRAAAGGDGGDAARMAPASDVLARNAEEPPVGDAAPLVELRGTSVVVEGAPAGDVHEVDATKRPKRVDELFSVLQGKREAWRQSNPGKSFAGLATFRLPATASELVVRSVVQTAAFAGYPTGSFEVRRPDGTAGRLVMDISVPLGPMWQHLDDEPPPQRTLHVRLAQDGKVTLEWRDSPHAIASTQDTNLEGLAPALQAAWRDKGVMRAGKTHDPALLHFSSEASFATMIQVADAVAGVKREGGDRAFDASLSFGP